MADTPRGPRPTRTRAVVSLLVAGWLVVGALVVAAAVAPRTSFEGGWSRERLTIVKLPYADCSADDHCTMRPTVELPDGSRATPKLVIRHPDELLPSAHFREGGTLLLWVGGDPGDRELRSLRPIRSSARHVAYGALGAAALLGAALVMLSVRASRAHESRASRAGHAVDHVAVWVLPAVVLVLGITLLVLHQSWRTPQHEPTKPPAGSTSRSR